jgi:hypothetical protein
MCCYPDRELPSQEHRPSATGRQALGDFSSTRPHALRAATPFVPAAYEGDGQRVRATVTAASSGTRRLLSSSKSFASSQVRPYPPPWRRSKHLQAPASACEPIRQLRFVHFRGGQRVADQRVGVKTQSATAVGLKPPI